VAIAKADRKHEKEMAEYEKMIEQKFLDNCITNF